MSTPFNTAYVAGLLGTGIQRVYKLAPLCDVGPQRKSGKIGRGSRRGKNRHYSAEDICRIALAYWLFRAGLRGPYIAAILAEESVDRFIAPLDSFKQVQIEADRARFLVAWGFKTAPKAKKWVVKPEGVMFVGSLRRTPVIVRNQSCIIVPVGRLLQGLAEKMWG